VEAAVVGSALVALVEQAGSATEAASALADRVRALKRACRAS
jgi:tryptophan synthase alpha subunit